jgi:hypothetical protein
MEILLLHETLSIFSKQDHLCLQSAHDHNSTGIILGVAEHVGVRFPIVEQP